MGITLIIIALILLNGIFSMSEIALVSAKKFKLEMAAKNGHVNAKKALQLAGNPSKFLSTVQFGITLIGILLGIFSGEKITGKLQAAISEISALEPYAHSLAVLIIVITITFFSIVFGELIPKRIGLMYPDTIALAVARPMHLLAKIAAPFIWLLVGTNNLFMRILGIKENEEKITEEEIKALVQQSAQGGEIQEIEHHIVDRVFELGDRKVAELMTHRTDIKWLDINDTIETVRDKTNDKLHSIYPVANGNLDKLIGVVDIKEIFAANIMQISFELKDFIRKPLVVHNNTPAYIVLEKFRQNRFHHAVVVDDYGSVLGIITIDDVLDALVGDMSSYDRADYKIVKRDHNSWLVDAQYSYYEFLNYFQLVEANLDENYNTLAGLLLDRIGQMPKIGDKIRWKGFEIEIVDMDGMRIDKLLIRKIS